MISTQYSSLIGAAPSGIKRQDRLPDGNPQDGFHTSSTEQGGPSYGAMRFPEAAAEVKSPAVSAPWKGVMVGAMLAFSVAGGTASAACAQTLPNPSDVQASKSLEFLDHAGHLYQNKGGLLGGQKPATPAEAFKQLKGGSSVYWSQSDGQAKQTIKDLKSLDQFVDSVKQQSQR